MSLLVGYLLPALLISGAALLALSVARRAPPGVRLGIAVIGLLAWTVPWSLLDWSPLSPDALQFKVWVSEGEAQLSAFSQAVVVTLEAVLPASALPSVWWLMLLVPGLLWFLADLTGYTETVNRWRQNSTPGQELARYLPAGIKGRAPRIQIVANSSVAAATGWIRPTIWIGDRVVAEQELQSALTHEAIHLCRRDPVWLMAVGLLGRLFWFNPIVYGLRRQAVLAIESSCDEECARLLGRQSYRKTLARLILENQQGRSLALAPALQSSSVDLLRLASLEVRPRMGGVAWAALTTVVLACLGGAALGSVALEEPVINDRPGISDSSHNGYDEPRLWSLQEGEVQ